MSEDEKGQSPSVRHAQDAHRFEVWPGEELAGFTEYVDHDKTRIFYHTEVDEKFSGQGLASILVAEALTATRESGLRIVPVCPYVARWVKTHHDFDDILDPVTPVALEVVREATK